MFEGCCKDQSYLILTDSCDNSSQNSSSQPDQMLSNYLHETWKFLLIGANISKDRSDQSLTISLQADGDGGIVE